jgi:hypothetical protein
MEKDRGQAVKLQLSKEHSLIKYLIDSSELLVRKTCKNKNNTDVCFETLTVVTNRISFLGD